jgi:membrane-associated phospholipid phosphatase
MIEKILIFAPYTIYQASLLAFIISGKIIYLYFTMVYILFGEMLNVLCKKIFSHLLPPSISSRPSICGNSSGNNCNGCGIFPTNNYNHKLGFPSGHAQMTAFACMFWTLYILESNHKHKFISILILWLITFLVFIQRIYSKCHSILQVFIGAILGIFFALMTFKIIKNTNILS